MTSRLTRTQIQLLYTAASKAIPDEMRREATVHGVVLEEKRRCMTLEEEKAWILHGIKPKRKKKDKNNG